MPQGAFRLKAKEIEAISNQKSAILHYAAVP
jgi:hypothetical protein